jgi:hypothetical protein
MADQEQESSGVRARILRAAFPRLDFDGAVALVGILFEYRIVFSRRSWSLLRQHGLNIPLERLEPQEAAIVVGQLYSMDCDALYCAFEKRWAQLKPSPFFREMVARIESHEPVGRLEQWPSAP